MFRTASHEDAHEFLSYLLNALADHITSNEKTIAALVRGDTEDATVMPETPAKPAASWLSDLFGIEALTVVTCDNCQTVRSVFSEMSRRMSTKKIGSPEQSSERKEPSLDLSLDIPEEERAEGAPALRLEECLQYMSRPQLLSGANQFHCERCASLQDARMQTTIGKVSRVLALHLKRFRWVDGRGHVKISARVEFGDTLSVAGHDFQLFAVLVHIGG